ncbi:hypothetical protein EV426DRAFT_711140 [Tirmania nivea]|nr:hypothetical protein EV426DRAFT_711140 [Tirmania nivea]
MVTVIDKIMSSLRVGSVSRSRIFWWRLSHTPMLGVTLLLTVSLGNFWLVRAGCELEEGKGPRRTHTVQMPVETGKTMREGQGNPVEDVAKHLMVRTLNVLI